MSILLGFQMAPIPNVTSLVCRLITVLQKKTTLRCPAFRKAPFKFYSTGNKCIREIKTIFGNISTCLICVCSVSDPDPDWIWIQGSSGSGSRGLKTGQKCLINSNHNIILLYRDFYILFLKFQLTSFDEKILDL